MKELLSNGKLLGLKIVNFDMCESCVMGKHKKLSFFTGGRKARVEIEIGLKIKCLRYDNGEEYIDGGFKEYCAINGIRMEKTILETP